MAKYSKSFYMNLQNPDLNRPHIFLDVEFTYLISISSLRNKATKEFCEKLNNAAPKRGLKA